VATVGFPNIGLQGFEPKLSKGDISSLAGIQDDVKQFQISVPIQHGNSGGALVDERGNVVGVVCAQLSQKAALETTGTLAQNVNYAIKSSYLLSFLEAVPEVSGGLLEAKTNDQKFEAVVDDVKKATVLIIGY
jgi:S1-C subfamily serine protease